MRNLITILFFPIIFFSCSDSTPVNDIDQILPGEPQQVLNYDSLHEIDNIDSFEIKGYEFLLVLKKIKNIISYPQKNDFTAQFSKTSYLKAINEGFSSPEKLFRSIGYE